MRRHGSRIFHDAILFDGWYNTRCENSSLFQNFKVLSAIYLKLPPNPYTIMFTQNTFLKKRKKRVQSGRHIRTVHTPNNLLNLIQQNQLTLRMRLRPVMHDPLNHLHLTPSWNAYWRSEWRISREKQKDAPREHSRVFGQTFQFMKRQQAVHQEPLVLRFDRQREAAHDWRIHSQQIVHACHSIAQRHHIP